MQGPFFRTRPISPGHAGYPSGLYQLPATRFPNTRWAEPPVLHVRGAFPSAPMLAIVGTRDPCEHAGAWVREVVRALGADGWVVGSGGAEGIDAEVHRAALDAGATTVVVTTGGLDGPPYPEKHAPLFRDVLDAGGALVSIHQDGVRRGKPDFLARNHVLAAMAFAVIAVELRPDRRFGGTGHTGRSALVLGRPVMCVAHAPWSRGGPGAVQLMRLGARAVATADDVRDVLAKSAQLGLGSIVAPMAPELLETEPAAVELDPAERTVLAALGNGALHVDGVCLATGLSASVASRALLTCTLHGVVVEGPTGMFFARS